MNQIIFTDFGVIVALDTVLTQETTSSIGKAVSGWVEGSSKVLVLPLANWEIIDKRREPTT